MNGEKRLVQRTKVWPETQAVLVYRTLTEMHDERIVSVKGHVKNISAKGVFVNTGSFVPKRTRVILTIDFDPGSQTDIVFSAKGYVARTSSKGVAIQFTDADANRLGDCIITKLNQS